MSDDQAFEAFKARVRDDLIPKIASSRVFLSIVPPLDKIDVQFAIQLGIAVLLDKPIIACVPPGTAIPEKLARVVDRFVELDLADPTWQSRLMKTIGEMTETLP